MGGFFFCQNMQIPLCYHESKMTGQEVLVRGSPSSPWRARLEWQIHLEEQFQEARVIGLKSCPQHYDE